MQRMIRNVKTTIYYSLSFKNLSKLFRIVLISDSMPSQWILMNRFEALEVNR